VFGFLIIAGSASRRSWILACNAHNNNGLELLEKDAAYGFWSVEANHCRREYEIIESFGPRLKHFS
jgi:hypothetical protein